MTTPVILYPKNKYTMLLWYNSLLELVRPKSSESGDRLLSHTAIPVVLKQTKDEEDDDGGPSSRSSLTTIGLNNNRRDWTNSAAMSINSSISALSQPSHSSVFDPPLLPSRLSVVIIKIICGNEMFSIVAHRILVILTYCRSPL